MPILQATIYYFTYFAMIAFMFVRFLLPYKKGVVYAGQNGTAGFRKLSEVQYVFFVLGIIGAIVVSLIPFVNVVGFIFEILMFLRFLRGIVYLTDPSVIKPARIATMGFGLGVCGTLGFIIGLYRGSLRTIVDARNI